MQTVDSQGRTGTSREAGGKAWPLGDHGAGKANTSPGRACPPGPRTGNAWPKPLHHYIPHVIAVPFHHYCVIT